MDKKKVIAITRPFNRIDEAVKIVEEHGSEAFIVPTLELEIINSLSLKKLISQIDDLNWLIFTSPTSIESIFHFYPNFNEKINDNIKIAAIGTKTRKTANDHDLVVDLIPKDFTAEGLIKAMENFPVENQLIGIPRTLEARDTLPEELKKRGANVFIAESYKSVIPRDVVRIELLISKILKNEIDAITFTSPLTVKNLFEIANDEQVEELKNKLSTSTVSMAIGPITHKVLENFNITAYYPNRYTVKDMMDYLFENLL
ncbi:MAG: uroporphyrinogen-III synthase [Methanobrevibacter sp.]|jgi:uroporphyrinogen-III synthase|nr:uroporphyrinogen-III synthase [Methanobrevibacter sp.]